MRTFLLISIGFLLSFAPVYGFTDEDLLKISPPLGIMLGGPNMQEGGVEIPNPQQYLKALDKNVVGSILSYEERWKVWRQDRLQENAFRHYKLFLDWYFTKLPFVIFAIMQNGNTTKTGTITPNFKEMRFLSAGEPTISEQIVAFAERYQYNYPQKLNLFLHVLYKNISDQELLKLMQTWNIKQQTEVYLNDYIEYWIYFAESALMKDEEKQEALQLFTSNKGRSLTTVLHELLKSNKASLFKELLKHPEVNVNAQNYLSQTVLHLSANRVLSESSTYISALLEHNNTQLNIIDYQGWTPAFYAVANADTINDPVLEMFLAQKQKLNLTITDFKNRTLPLVAAELGHSAVAKFLHQRGAPLPKQVSLLNSYMNEDYQAVWFEYKNKLTLDNISNIFNLQVKMETIPYPVFEQFEIQDLEQKISEDSIWSQFKYHFLFDVLKQVIDQSENNRHIYINSMVFEGEHSPLTKLPIALLIKALYLGDLQEFQKVYFQQKAKQKEDPHTSIILKELYTVMGLWAGRVISKFELLGRVEIESESDIKNKFRFFLGIGSLLSEAVRVGNLEIVRFLLEQGASPVFNEQHFVTRNSIVIGILMTELLHIYPDRYENHLRIMDMLIQHPLVTKDFLSSEVFPGIRYTDLAMMTGNLKMLKQMYEKEAVVSDAEIWDTGVKAELFAHAMRYLKTEEFVLENKIANKEGNIEERAKHKEQLKDCRNAFH